MVKELCHIYAICYYWCDFIGCDNHFDVIFLERFYFLNFVINYFFITEMGPKMKWLSPKKLKMMTLLPMTMLEKCPRWMIIRKSKNRLKLIQLSNLHPLWRDINLTIPSLVRFTFRVLCNLEICEAKKVLNIRRDNLRIKFNFMKIYCNVVLLKISKISCLFTF